MIRFAIKAGLAAGAVYYIKEEGIWKESQEALKAYDKLNTAMEPYVGEIRKQIPFELPKIPASDRTTENIQLYWNKGVTSSFEFLSELPGLVSTWTRNGVNAVLENPEVKKLLK
ncbi:hypothetical protein Zmor_027643 [Zophobas morio]|uniref:MICOS complex subunit MIC13 n=1 Tax=Zophobas morio TaxID=2755281 RepID=A0AA38HP07_9CUCU|nr:hypothetical protein Zmor_027643 [Zophobas morio]